MKMKWNNIAAVIISILLVIFILLLLKLPSEASTYYNPEETVCYVKHDTTIKPEFKTTLAMFNDETFLLVINLTGDKMIAMTGDVKDGEFGETLFYITNRSFKGISNINMFSMDIDAGEAVYGGDDIGEQSELAMGDLFIEYTGEGFPPSLKHYQSVLDGDGL
jgi:hypothetical protein